MWERGKQTEGISPEPLRDVKDFTRRAKGIVVSTGILAVKWRIESRKGTVCIKRPSGTVSQEYR